MSEQQKNCIFLQHTAWLNCTCRLCGLKSKKLVHKKTFKKELLEVCDIDVEHEDSHVFPSKICSKHASMFYKYRNAKNNTKNYKTSISVCSFQHHSDQCPCTGKNDHQYTNMQGKKVKTYEIILNKHKTHEIIPEKVEQEGIETLFGLEEHETNLQITTNSTKFCHDESSTSPLIETFNKIPQDKRNDNLKNFVNYLSTSDRKLMVSVILNSEEKEITKDIETIQDSFTNLQDVKDMNLEDYIHDRNEFMKFLLGILTKSNLSNDDYDKCSMAVLLEHIYKLRNSHFIGPVSLLKNLTIFSHAHSRTVADIIGKISAGGKYTTICKWLDTSAKPPDPPNGDAIYVFDNEQVVGKTWNVKPNNKAKCSVITNIAVAEVNDTVTVQADKDLHPKKWCCEERSIETVDKLLNENDIDAQSFKQTHLSQLKLFINAAIEQVISEQNDDFKDDIDKLSEKLKSAQTYKICPRCKDLFDKSKRKCPVCKETIVRQDFEVAEKTDKVHEVKIQKIDTETNIEIADQSLQEESFLRYEHIESGHKEKPIPLTLIDPVFVNPNSYENLVLVLRHIGKTAGVKRYGGNREWLTVCCDGLPYTMLVRLTQEYLLCTTCKKGYIGGENFEKHIKIEHPQINAVEHVREFDWVHLKIGDGYYEMNLMKSFIDINWEVFFKELVIRMGWKSELAQKAARNCYDNHKSWQLILIYHYGTLMELIIPYVRACISNENNTPSADGFLQYAKNREHDTNFKFLLEMTTRYSQAIINFRMGCRRNNSKLIQSAKYMSRGLFHGRCHPRYQLIEMYDSMQRCLQPETLRKFNEDHETMTRTYDKTKGQGFDFILEEINKEVKTWIRKGVPTDSMWLSVCRNHHVLKDIRENSLGMFRVKADSTYTRRLDLEDGIRDWRALLRSTSYLHQPTEMPNVIHKSLSGNELHPELVNFTDTARRKRSYRLMETFLNQDIPADPQLKHPVFVTDAEANKYEAFENQTVTTIDRLILDMMECIADDDVKNGYKDQFQRDVKKKKKEVHISFFHEVENIVKESPNLPEIELESEN